MRLIENLTRLTLYAAMVSGLLLGSTAIAQDPDSDLTVEEPGEGAIEHPAEQDQAGERHGEHRFYMQRTEDQFMRQKPDGAVYAESLIGKPVKHRQSGDVVGEIHDFVIGDNGRIIGVLVVTGGFLGLGGQNVSLRWDQLEHALEDGDALFYTDLDTATMRNAPKYGRKFSN